MFWLYAQQLTCDAHQAGCLVNVSVHPEDRFASQYDPGRPENSVVIVGIDDASVRALQRYPLPRHVYANALQNLEKAGAQVVAFDIGFTDPSGDEDNVLALALASASVPVVLAYGSGNADVGSGKVIQQGIDQIPLKQLRCADANSDPKVACSRPYPKVTLASTDLVLDRDGVVRRIPLTDQPACFAAGSCTKSSIDTFGLAAYRTFVQSGEGGADLEISNGTARFGEAWSVPVDGSGSVLVNFSGPPGNFKEFGHYLSFSQVVNGSFDPEKVNGKIVLVGYYGLTGVNDEQLVTTSFGINRTLAMAGVEIHANVVQMLLNAVGNSVKPSRFLTAEPPWVLLALLLVLGLATAIGVARVTVLRGVDRHCPRTRTVHLRNVGLRDLPELGARPFPSVACGRADVFRCDRVPLPLRGPRETQGHRALRHLPEAGDRRRAGEDARGSRRHPSRRRASRRHLDVRRHPRVHLDVRVHGRA